MQSDEDRRSAHLHLTEKGKLINVMHDYAHKCIAEHILKKIDRYEQRRICRFIKQNSNQIIFCLSS